MHAAVRTDTGHGMDDAGRAMSGPVPALPARRSRGPAAWCPARSANYTAWAFPEVSMPTKSKRPRTTATARPRGPAAPPPQSEQDALLDTLRPVVEMLGGMLGDNIEIVLHDLRSPARSIVAIGNGHVSGRGVGDSILSGPKDDAGFVELHREVHGNGRISSSVINDYPTATGGGRKLRSATVLYRDGAGEPFAALCLNADMTVVEMAHSWLDQMLHRRSQPAAPAVTSSQMDTLMQEIIADAVTRFTKPAKLMDKEEKLYAVEAMMRRGLFLVRNSVGQAAKALGVTRFTIYNYLDEIRKRDQSHAAADIPERANATRTGGRRKSGA
ncbi:PAS domain-containing protein [Stenotrophomonas sp. MMGLT7]|uniref:helix-turn-helix transcriptional regulator n=1 Tax=Stenotrophomonas sp. MMGLT7 TaxID=2901227 RepID=UPI001E319D81|nr:PAS domain-containing protein [Stenotrophomonas sp. MMGLT7]